MFRTVLLAAALAAAVLVPVAGAYPVGATSLSSVSSEALPVVLTPDTPLVLADDPPPVETCPSKPAGSAPLAACPLDPNGWDADGNQAHCNYFSHDPRGEDGDLGPCPHADADYLVIRCMGAPDDGQVWLVARFSYGEGEIECDGGEFAVIDS